MILKDFGIGWQNKFEPKLQTLFNKLSGIKIERIERYYGMLRINVLALDNDIQFIVDCVTHVIERESVKTCEHCGKHAVRRYELISEPMCLCLTCYTLLVDSTLSQQTQ